MKQLTDQEIRHIAKLARLPLTDKEIEKFRGQLSSILDYMQKLNEVDTANVEPTFHASGNVANRFQEQKKGENTLPKKDVLQNAKEKDEDYVITKGVFTKE
ncbi:Asp-tRNA(Asn)/Glu-tRNA(Gln) amidotransferase subunit GatC [Candidatus Roizmanbacteria bacterium]|nr:Asp-tRNA(Asn)/Glu-tRNA(Gln) amidotransferase subunit GatC [Candidatus Roizmanbacteria bacterium]